MTAARGTLRRRTLQSFDYQWRAMPTGQALLADPSFRGQVASILTDQELCIDPAWLAGKEVLDAGCGNGRWAYGLLELGARVTAVDASPAACEAVRSLAPGHPRLEVRQENLLELSAELRARRFDLVFSWGVLHHTGDTRGALRSLAHLVKDDGFMYVYLYGRRSLSRAGAAKLSLLRTALLPFSPAMKHRLLGLAYPRQKLHNVFDVLGPPINDRTTVEEVAAWFREVGLTEHQQTVRHTEVFVKAWRRGAAARAAFRAPRDPPYWFQSLT